MLAIGAARPYLSNQNAYLLHGVGGRLSTLDRDWLLSTADSFPPFSAIVGVVHRIGGETGVMVASGLSAATALFGVFLIASALLRGHRSSVAIATLATLLVASAHPLAWMIWRNPDFSTFGGFGGQYIFVGAGYLQPANAGAFVLVAIGIRALAGRGIPERVAVATSVALIATTCALHPGYLLPVLVGGLACLVAGTFVSRSRRIAFESAGTMAAAVAAVAVTSPVWRSSLGASSEAFEFLAFVRIPHHTLWTNWSRMDALLILLVVIAALLARRWTTDWSIAIAFFVALLVGLGAAILVERAHLATLGIAAPWRVSVFLVPIASTIVATSISRALVETSPRRLFVWAAIGLVGISGAVCGLYTSLAEVDPRSKPPVQLVRDSAPAGVGLVPLDLDHLRLNAGFPIFVDWKSHPHQADDLEEWIRRIGLVQASTGDHVATCRLIAEERISWVLDRNDAPVPDCFVGWERRIEGDFRILIDTADGSADE